MNEQTLYFSWPALTEETANYLPHIHASVGETLLVQLPSRQGPADNTCLGHYPCLSGNASQIRTWGICGSISEPCITEWESRWLSVCLRCVSEITFAKLFSSGSSKGKGGRSGLTQSHCGGRGERVWCSQLSKTHKLSCRYTERDAPVPVDGQFVIKLAERHTDRGLEGAANMHHVCAHIAMKHCHTHIQLRWLKIRGF